jgi:hypothetical protein
MGRFRRLTAVAVVVGGTVVLTPATSNAEVTTPAGRCVGTAEFQKGYEGTGKSFKVDSTTLRPDEVLIIPASDDVAWSGSLIGVAQGRRPVSGSITLELPVGSIDLGSWGPTGSTTSSSGAESYDLGFLPRGVEFTVEGAHYENGQLHCSGKLTVALEGGAFDTPFAPISIGVTLFSGLGLVLCGRPKVRVKVPGR